MAAAIFSSMIVAEISIKFVANSIELAVMEAVTAK